MVWVVMARNLANVEPFQMGGTYADKEAAEAQMDKLYFIDEFFSLPQHQYHAEEIKEEDNEQG